MKHPFVEIPKDYSSNVDKTLFLATVSLNILEGKLVD